VRHRSALTVLIGGVLWLALAAGVDREARANPRVALVIGNNAGLATDAPLHYAESDAVEMSRALVEAGVIPKDAVYRLLGGNAAAAAHALEAVASRAGGGGDVLLFFSGHGDAAGAHLAGTIWAWTDIRRAMSQARVNLLVGFFDACASGALVTAKGFVRGPPLAVAVAPVGPSGRFLVTSSGANEFSYESVELGGSPFSFHLRSALRGAADGDHDGRVTLSEVYDYLYARTVASTLAAPLGPQRPVQSVDLRGAGEWEIATLAGLVRLSRGRIGGGPCFILDRGERRLLAELGTAAEAEVALPPGAYVAKCAEGGDHLRTAALSLGGLRASMESARFTDTPRPYALAKGGGASAGHELAVTTGLALGVRADNGAGISLALRYRLDLGGFALHLQATGVSSPRTIVPALGFGARLPAAAGSATSAEVGVLLGARFGSARDAEAVGVGPFFQVQCAVARGLGILGRVEFLSFYPVTGSGAGNTNATGSLLLSAGVALDLGPSARGSPNGSSGELTVVSD